MRIGFYGGVVWYGKTVTLKVFLRTRIMFQAARQSDLLCSCVTFTSSNMRDKRFVILLSGRRQPAHYTVYLIRSPKWTAHWLIRSFDNCSPVQQKIVYDGKQDASSLAVHQAARCSHDHTALSALDKLHADPTTMAVGGVTGSNGLMPFPRICQSNYENTQKLQHESYAIDHRRHDE